MSRGLPKLDVEGLTSFIPEDEIQELLSKKTTDIKHVRDIIAKSLDKNRLNPDEMAVLLNAEDPEVAEEIKEGARTLKKRIYGNRIVLVCAALYRQRLHQQLHLLRFSAIEFGRGAQNPNHERTGKGSCRIGRPRA